ncbi:MAG: hypothetical protein ACOYJ2_04600 [Rickettsiales bacterium]
MRKNLAKIDLFLRVCHQTVTLKWYLLKKKGKQAMAFGDFLNPERLAERAAGAAEEGILGFLTRNWLLLLAILAGGPVLASNFRQSWMPGWLTDFGDMIIGLLSQLPFVGNFFGNMVQGRAEQWTAEEAQENLQERAQLPVQLAQALAQNDAAWRETAVWLRETGRTTVMNPVTPTSVRAMLTDPTGRTIASRFIAGINAARAAGTLTPRTTTPTPAEGAQPDIAAQAQGLVTQAGAALGVGNITDRFSRALREALSGAEGLTLVNNTDAMAVLYSGAEAITGIRFQNNGLQTFANTLTAEARQQFFIGMLSDSPQQTISALIARQAPYDAVNPTALNTFIRSIDASTVPEAYRADITRAQTIDPATFAAASATVTAITAEGRLLNMNSMIVAIAADGSTINGAGVAAAITLAPPSDELPADSPVRTLLSNPDVAGHFVTLVQNLGAARANELMQTFTSGSSSGLTVTQPEFVHLQRFANAVVPLTRANQPLVSIANSEMIAGLSLISRSANAQALTTTTTALGNMTTEAQAVLAELRGKNTIESLDILFDNTSRGHLMSGGAANMNGLGAALRIAPVAGMEFLGTASANGTQQNIGAILQLIAQVDASTGSEVGGNEDEADNLNGRVLSFMLAFSNSGDTPVSSYPGAGGKTYYRFGANGAGVTTEELASFFSNPNNSEAFVRFFGGNSQMGNEGAITAFDLNTLPANSPQRRVFEYLRTNFWTDDNNNDIVDRGTDPNRLGWWVFSGEGLAQILADEDAVQQMLNNMGGPPSPYGAGERYSMNYIGARDSLKDNWDILNRLLEISRGASR